MCDGCSAAACPGREWPPGVTQLITLTDWGLFWASAGHTAHAETQRRVLLCCRHQITKAGTNFLLVSVCGVTGVGPPAALFLSGDISDTL